MFKSFLASSENRLDPHKTKSLESLYDSYLSKETKIPKSSSTFSLQNQTPLKIWLSEPKKLSEIEKFRENKLKKSVTSKSGSTIRLDIYKLLALNSEKSETFIKIPETIVIGFGLPSPVFLFNDEKGRVRALEDLSNQHLKLIIELFVALNCRNTKKVSPLAIKRESHRLMPKLLMKPSEIMLEWKNSYKIDAVIQRFISGKGFKTSKIVSNQSKELKVYKFINRVRNDLNTTNTQEIKPRTSIFKPKTKSLAYFKQFLIIERRPNLDAKSPELRNENSILKTALAKVEVQTIGVKIEGKPAEKPSILKKNNLNSETSNPNFKKTFMNFKDYLDSCQLGRVSRPVEEIVKDLKNCRFQDSELLIEGNEDFALRYFGPKLNESFLVSCSKSGKVDSYEIKSETLVKNCAGFIQEIKKLIEFSYFADKSKKISQVSCEYVQDAFGNVYFLSLRSLKIVDLPKSLKMFNFSQVFNCPGKFCKTSQKKHSNKPSFPVLNKNIWSKNDFEITGNTNYLDKARVCRECFEASTSKAKRPRTDSFSGLRLQNFEKNEVSWILNEINPRNSTETCKNYAKKNEFTTLSTQVSENVIKEKEVDLKMRKRIQIFNDRYKEIIDNANFNI